MAVDSSEEGQDVYSMSVLPDEPDANLPCESKLSILSLLEVSNSFKSQKCLDAQLNCQDYIKLPMEKTESYSPRSVDVDIEKGNIETPITDEEMDGRLKAEGPLTHMQRVMNREISLHIGGKLMQLLIDHSLMLLKFTSRDKSVIERVHDTPNNRWRKYKRSTSFDSRKVVLMFSVLSSMGTMILIYLTLRVRQMGDGSAPV